MHCLWAYVFGLTGAAEIKDRTAQISSQIYFPGDKFITIVRFAGELAFTLLAQRASLKTSGAFFNPGAQQSHLDSNYALIFKVLLRFWR